TTHTHTSAKSPTKKMILKGSGRTTTRPWGGDKEVIHSYKAFTQYKGDEFHINLTNKVGKNIWHSGKINGKGPNQWLHSNHLRDLNIKESNTSRLGRIKSGDRSIYKTLSDQGKSASKYQGSVYYIKRQAKV